MHAGAEPPISVVVATRRSRVDCAAVVTSVADQVAAVGGETIVASLTPIASLPLATRNVVADGDDVFVARAAGIAAASGSIVVILEDHTVVTQHDFVERLLAAWEREPELGGLVHAVTNGTPGPVDDAAFLVTLGPFPGPTSGLATNRIPVPGLVSYRRCELVGEPRPPGWLEYELPCRLRAEGRLGIIRDVIVEHRQHGRLTSFLALHFSSGRAYAGATAGTPWRGARLAWRNGGVMIAETLRAARCREPRAAPVRTQIVAVMLCLANVVGQLVGSVAGEGSARGRLE